ncbi:MAG: hypothetical protein Q8N30_03290 [Methylococcales bacterium]|nr:hypothetical protein [Methylococcales bacterium]
MKRVSWEAPETLAAGKLDKITLTIDRPTLSPEDIKKPEQAQCENQTSQ